MKHILLMLVALGFTTVSAQVSCNIDPNNNIYGASPSADSFPCVERTKYFEQVVQILVPPNFSTTTIDSFRVNNVSGIPSGMQYVCNPPNCTFNGGQRGCFIFYGTTSDTAGIYELGFNGTAFVKLGTSSQPIPLDEQAAKDAGFDLYVKVINPGDSCREAQPLSIANVQNNQPSIKAYANSNQTELFVAIAATEPVAGNVSLMNLLGEVVTNKQVNATTDMLTAINIANQPKGLYLVVFQTGSKVFSTRVVLK